jgi:hypothetical protein
VQEDKSAAEALPLAPKPAWRKGSRQSWRRGTDLAPLQPRWKQAEPAIRGRIAGAGRDDDHAAGGCPAEERKTPPPGRHRPQSSSAPATALPNYCAPPRTPCCLTFFLRASACAPWRCSLNSPSWERCRSRRSRSCSGRRGHCGEADALPSPLRPRLPAGCYWTPGTQRGRKILPESHRYFFRPTLIVQFLLTVFVTCRFNTPVHPDLMYHRFYLGCSSCLCISCTVRV